MSEEAFTVAAIRPLVAHERATGRHLVLTFRCPATGQQVQAQWTAPQDTGIGSQVAAAAKTSAMYEVRRQVNSMLRSLLGGGSMARVATQAVNTAMYSVPSGTSGPVALSARQKEEGLVAAFRTVSSQFAWVGQRWIHTSGAAEARSGLDQQLAEAPVQSRYDRLLTARMLVEVAGAHGGIGDEERLHLGETLDPDLGSLESLLKRPPLTSAELGEATEGPTRVSMLTAAWTLALCDEHFDPAEGQRLKELARGLGLRTADEAHARSLAQSWLLDQALERMFTWGGHDTNARAQLYSLGDRIGMSREEVELAEARFQKRRAG